MTSSGHLLDSRQIHEQYHDDLDSFSEITQNSDIDIISLATLMPKQRSLILVTDMVILMMVRQVR